MTSGPPSQLIPLARRFGKSYGIWLLYALAFGYILTGVVLRFPDIETRLIRGDNDDLMRLVSLRDWLGGQGWYDSHQYRLLPPEGVVMHWSRYVDLGLALLYWPLSTLMPSGEAELWAVTLWPSLLWAIAVVVAGQGSRALLGPLGAVIAVLAVLSWGKISSEFQPGRIDHHNLQILLGLSIFYLAVLPSRPLFYGAAAGALTALSLAIGLEMLPYLAMIWFMAALRHALDLPGSRAHLLGFAFGIGLGAPLLMAGQLAPALWSTPYCDVLAAPLLLLTAIGICATLVPLLLKGRSGPRPSRLLLMLLVAGLGIAAAWPVLGPCARGPYAMIAPETQAIIDTRITEGMAIGLFFSRNPIRALVIILPAVLSLLSFSLLIASRPGALRRRMAHLGIPPASEAAIIGAYAILAVSLLLALTQIRAANLMTPVLPFALAALVVVFFKLPQNAPARSGLMVMMLASLPMSSNLAVPAVLPMLDLPGTTPSGPTPCRSPEAMAELAVLPPQTLIFSTLNFGAAILAYTPYAATSAPYHRSNAAFWNGIGPFENEPAMKAALEATKADVLMLCHVPTSWEGEFLHEIRAGKIPAWLSLIPPSEGLAAEDQPRETLLYRVNHAALGAKE